MQRVRRINKTVDNRDMRVESRSSMSRCAVRIEGWRVLDDAGKCMMLGNPGADGHLSCYR